MSPKNPKKKYTKIIVSEATRLEKILRSVLTLTKDAPLNKEKQSINEIVNDSLEVFHVVAEEKSINVHTHMMNTPHILADKVHIREVIDNILSNSIDAMPNGGELTVATGTKHQDDEAFVTIEITDTGGGIAEDKLSRIFEPFFTTRAAGNAQGIRLGLSISKRIMEEHGGFIRVESEAAKGTTFRIFFPSQLNSTDLDSLPSGPQTTGAF